MFCTECGRNLADTVKFCVGCGKAVRISSQAVPERAVKIIAKKSAAGAHRYSAGRMVATIALCLLLFVFISVTSLVLIIRHTFSEHNISNTVAQLDVALIIDEFDIYERIRESLEENAAAAEEELDIEPSAVRRILARDSVRDFVADSVTGYVDALIRGERSYEITRQDVMGLIRGSAGVIYDEIGIYLDEDDFDEIEEYIRSNDVLEEISLGAVSSSAQIDLDLLRRPLMPSTLITLIILNIVTFVGILALNIRRVRKALLGFGLSIFLAGLLCLAAGLLFFDLISALTGGTLSRALAENLLAHTRSTAFLISLVLLVLGAVLITSFVSFILITKSQNKMRIRGL